MNKKYFRPNEVDSLLGNSSKALKNLKWRPKYKFYDLIKEMIDNEIKLIKKN